MTMKDDPVVPRLRTDIAMDAYEILLTSLGVVCVPSNGEALLSQTDYPNRKGRVSVKRYPAPSDAIDAWYAGTVEWGPWRPASNSN